MFKWVNRKFTNRVIAVFAVLLIVVSLSVMIWTAVYTSKVVYGSYEKTLGMLFENKARDVRELIERTELALDLLLDDENSFSDMIIEKNNDDVRRIHVFTDARRMFLTNLSISLNNITQNYNASLFVNEDMGAYEVCPNGDMVDITKNIPIGIYKIDTIKDSPQFTKIKESNGDMVWFFGENEKSIYAAKKLIKYRLIGGTASIIDMGIVCISFDISHLDKDLAESVLTQNAKISIENGDGEIIYSNTKSAEPSGKSVCYEFAISDNLTMKTIVPKSDVNKVTGNYILISVLIVFVFLMAGIGVVVLISKNITEPIVILSSHMENNNELKEIGIKEERADEIGNIYRSYNKMVSRINRMIEKLKEASIREKNMELRLMQLQINPHFIYNSLDNVNCRLLMMGEFEVANKISELVNYMRYNMKNPEEASTVKKETEMIKSYMHALELQYEDRIRLKFDIPDELMNCSMPKMLLQPLVENSVTHGIETTGSRFLDIVVLVKRHNDDLKISVTDSGNCTNLDEINRHMAGEINISKNRGYGIRNVNERLKLIYGEGYHLEYNKDEQGHTRASFNIKYEICTDTG